MTIEIRNEERVYFYFENGVRFTCRIDKERGLIINKTSDSAESETITLLPTASNQIILK